MRLYVSGPMRGYPELNYPAFRAATALYRSLGHQVTSPAEIGDLLGEGHAPQEYLTADIVEVLHCDAMALLPGWEKSTGARCEAAIAVTLGFAFYNERGARIPAPAEILIRGGYERPVELPVEIAKAG